MVLDVFAGCGTTALCCYEQKRKYIGFEISQEYWKIANDRVDEAKAQISFFELMEAL